MTHPAASAEPGPGGVCRVCTTQLPEGSLRCSHCGAVYGESNRCPHCKAVADVKPSRTLRYGCSVCGAPRVPIDDPNIARSGREVRALEKAQRTRVRATAARAGAYVTGFFGVLSVLVALLALAFITPGVLGSVGLAVAVTVPFVLALFAWRRARQADRELDTLLDQAWALSAADVLRARGHGLDAAELARIMRLDESQAEQLIAGIDVNDFLRARVSDESADSGAAAERLRVGADEEPEPAEAAAESERARSKARQ